MSLGSFLKEVWDDITDPSANQAVTTDAAASAQAAYANLLAKEQGAAKWVSSALVVLNNNITQDAALVAPLITAIDPSINIADVTSTFIGLVATFNTDQSKIPTTLVGAIQMLQAYLLPKTGNPWVIAVQGLLALGVTIISPETSIQKILAAGEYIYQDIITPIFHLHPSTPVPIVPPSVNGIVNAPVGEILPNGNQVLSPNA